MLTEIEARRIGIMACINKIGYEFCKKHADNSTSGYGLDDNCMYCFVGVSDQPPTHINLAEAERLVLSESRFPYNVSCNVNMENGEVTFLDCVLPTAS